MTGLLLFVICVCVFIFCSFFLFYLWRLLSFRVVCSCCYLLLLIMSDPVRKARNPIAARDLPTLLALDSDVFWELELQL